MSKVIRTIILLALLITPLMIAVTPASAAKPSEQQTLTGNDISWPQCNKAYPTGQAFGIVGVNNGLANNTNPCLSSQLAWADLSKGGTGQPKVALYVNTANPGHLSSSWPTSNDYAGVTVNNPYGTCTGAEDAACAYMYGWQKAYDDATIRGISNPSSYLWWLDVETENSWTTDKRANTADLEGMADYFKSIGARVGIYSTAYQWGQIVGNNVTSSSSLYSLDSWLAGSRNLANAKSNCSLPPLIAGGRVTLTQYVSRSFDYDYSCI